MPSYQISTPGGYEVEVKADDEQAAVAIAKEKWQSLPKIIAKGQDNLRVFETNSGQRYAVSKGYSTSDPAQIERLISGEGVQRLVQQGKNEAILERYPVAARTQEFARGTPFVGSGMDELAGAVIGPEAQQRSRELTTAMQQERPGETLGLNLAGGLTSGAALGAALPAVNVIGQGTRLAQMGRAGLVGTVGGGVEGATYGYLEGREGERGRAAGEGAALGAGLGGALSAAAPLAKDLASNVISTFKSNDVAAIASTLNISTNAAKVIKATFDQGGDIPSAITNLNRAGDQAMIADAGPAAQALLDAASQSGGRAGSITREAIGERMSQANQRLESGLDTSLGRPPLGPKNAVASISNMYKSQLSDAYEKAYSTPINYSTGPEGAAGQQIESVLKDIARADPDAFMQAVKSANLQAADDSSLLNYRQINATIDDSGNVTFDELPNVLQLDMLKRGLQAVAYKNTDDFGRLNSEGRVYASLAGKLRDAVATAVPDYRGAVSLGGDKLADERAFVLGRDLLRSKTEVEDVALELGSEASATQIQAAKMGLRSYLSKVLGDVRAIASDPTIEALEARQVMKAVQELSSKNARAKVTGVLGEQQADALLKLIDEAAQSSQVKAAMARNSATASRLAQKETIDEITRKGPGALMAEGDVIGTTKELISIATGATGDYTAKQRNAIYTDIARALTEKQGDEARAALQAIERAMSQQPQSDAEVEALAGMISSVLYPVAPAVSHGAIIEGQQ